MAQRKHYGEFFALGYHDYTSDDWSDIPHRGPARDAYNRGWAEAGRIQLERAQERMWERAARRWQDGRDR